VPSDLSKLEQMSTIFLHPETLVYHIGKELLVNGVEIIKKIQTSVNDFNSKDYYNGGKYLG